MINQERLVANFIEMVKVSSETRKEGDFAQKLKAILEELGLEVYVDNAGEVVGSNTGNIIAKLEGTIEKEPVLFCCHMDTVTPGVNINPVIKDGTIYSDGTTVLGADNKAGIACIIEAIRHIKEENIPHGPIELAFTIAEEGGLFGAKNLDYSRINSKMAYVLDSGGDPGQVVIKGPAQDKIVAKIIGKPAHAGVAPEEGISAIVVAAHAITNMNLLRIDEETTANVGVINGGQVTNIVCPEVEIKAEARSLNIEKLDAQTNHMVKCIEEACEKFGAKAQIDVERMYGPFNVKEDDDVVNKVRVACEVLGLKFYTSSTGGGSDTNVLNQHGIKAVNLGIGERKPHTLEEHIHIKDMVDVAKLVVELMK